MITRTVNLHDGDTVTTSDVDVDWKIVRNARDSELRFSDWRFMSDQSPSDEWIAYRVFLRDLPQNYDEANDAADALNEYEKPE